MKQNLRQLEPCPLQGYVAPEVEMLQVSVEKGFSASSSFGTGSGSGSPVTGNDYGWADEIEL